MGNAPLADAILQQRSIPDSVHVLEFSRSPQSFRDCLLHCPALEECREALSTNGFSSELPAGAKLFVRPQQVKPVMQALSSEGWNLKPRHVIVNDEFEDVVVKAVASLRSSDRVKQKSRATI